MLDYISLEMAKRYKAIPFDLEDDKIKVCFADTTDKRIFEAIRMLMMNKGLVIDPYVTYTDIIEDILRTKYFLIALALIFVGIILYLVDKKMPNNKVMNDLTIKEAFIIGCSQIFALIPGFSRSGTTIIAGRILKLDRENAAKFSFYLSAPVVIGAVVLQLLKCDLTIIVNNAGIFFLGMLISFVTGIICIKTLLQFLKHYDFKMFMLYRLIFGIFVIIYLLV